MNIKKTIITATVALTMAAMIAPMTAGALTAADLQAQINMLMSQLQGLTGSSSTGSMPAACVGVTFTRNLTVGSTGQDVKCFQVLLNTHGFVLGASGAGSPGMETMYFGPKTLASVRAWQVAQGWTPANQVGPLSRAKFNAWLAAYTGGPVVPGTPNPTPTGPISAMLSMDSPAAGKSVVGGQATADLAHFTFSGSGTVTSVSLMRSGISDQNTLSNVYLYDGNIRITDGYAFNVNGMITINGLSIAVNGTHTISVRADVASAAPTTASSIAVALTSFTANGSASTVSVQGNLMYVVVGNLASATITTAASSTVPTANVNAGTTGYTFWSAPLQVNTRAVWLKMANFRMIGSAPSDALGNIKLFIDGVNTGMMGTVMTINGSNYAVFDLNAAPVSLMTGSHTIEMRADVQKGTNRTIQVSIQNASDLTVFDPQVGVNVAVSSTTAGSFSANNAGTITILTGSVTVTVDPTFSAQTNVSGGAANVVIGKFKVHAYGEDVKVNSLNVTPEIDSATSTGATCTTTSGGVLNTGTCGLNNVTLYFNGSQIGSQVTYSSGTYTMGTTTSGTAITYTLGSQLIAPAGQDSWIEVRADLQTTANVSYTGGTVKVGLAAGSSNGQGMNSQATVNVPTAAVATNGLTIQTGGLQVSKNTAYLNQNISPNATGVRIGSYTIQNQSSSQSVRLTNFSIATTITTTTVSNFSALRTSDTTGSGSTPITFSGTQSGTTSTDTFSVNDVLAPGATMVLDVFANTGAATSGTIVTTLNVSSIGVTDNISTTSGAKTGQTLTLGTGTIANPPTLVTSSTTSARYVAAAGGAGSATAGGSQATFSFVSTSGASTITEIAFMVSGSDANPTQIIAQVCADATHCSAPVTVSSTQMVDLTALSLPVPLGGAGLTQNFQVIYSPVGTTGITPGSTITLSLAYVKYTTGVATKTLGTSTLCTALGVTCDATLSATVDAPVITMVGSKPTIVVAAGGSTGMILNTSTKVGQITITADAKGDVKVRQIDFAVGYSGFSTAPTSISSAFLAFGGQSTAISGSSCTVAGTTTNVVCGMHSADGVAYTYANDLTIPAGTSQQFDLYITTAGGLNTGTNRAQISTSLANLTSTSATAGTSAAFLWDDTSSNGGSGSTGLTGVLLYNFPTTAYAVSQ
jgi:energy-converting hydrogenase Eha subunit E